MSLYATVLISMVLAVQVQMVAVHVGDNVVMHVYNPLMGPVSAQTRLPYIIPSG